jgi:hypothetical protein
VAARVHHHASRRRGGGAVVIVSSISALRGSELIGAYGISKAPILRWRAI